MEQQGIHQGKSSSGATPLQHFYVAVGSAKAKLDTLIELITALNSTASRSLVICCGSRDVLDTVTATVRSIDSVHLWCLHADLSEKEIEATVQDFRRQGNVPAPLDADTSHNDHSSLLSQDVQRREADTNINGNEQGSSTEKGADSHRQLRLLLTTDSPLKVLSKESLPLAPTLLINYDIPTRKDVYLRRIASILGSRSRAAGGQRISISFVEAGKVAEFRQLESFAEREIHEMPVHVTDIFLPYTPHPGGEHE